MWNKVWKMQVPQKSEDFRRRRSMVACQLLLTENLRLMTRASYVVLPETEHHTQHRGGTALFSST